MNTKDRIMIESLKLFSEKGYEAVSVSEIASAVGIKAPSLYKHYSSKQDIFHSILDEMDKRYESLISTLELDGSNAQNDLSTFQMISEDQLVHMGKELFLHNLNDEHTCLYRKLLTRELHRSPKLAELYVNQFILAPLKYQSMLFMGLMATGCFAQGSPETAALQFYAPVPLLLSMCDGQPHKVPEALVLLENHIRSFDRMHRVQRGE
jgi:AcrR family transcriptional regulator